MNLISCIAGILMLIFVYSVYSEINLLKRKRMNRVIEIEIGMTERQAFEILGTFFDSKASGRGVDVYFWNAKTRNKDDVKNIIMKVKDRRVISIQYN